MKLWIEIPRQSFVSHPIARNYDIACVFSLKHDICQNLIISCVNVIFCRPNHFFKIWYFLDLLISCIGLFALNILKSLKTYCKQKRFHCQVPSHLNLTEPETSPDLHSRHGFPVQVVFKFPSYADLHCLTHLALSSKYSSYKAVDDQECRINLKKTGAIQQRPWNRNINTWSADNPQSHQKNFRVELLAHNFCYKLR